MLSLFACGGGSGGNAGGSGGSGGSGGGGGSGGPGGSPPPIYPGNRTILIRTGDTPSSAVYDSLHSLIFACEPDLGLVDAISISNGQFVARIPVPGIEAVGLSADDTKILASTNLQQVAWIDTTLLQVIKWQTLPAVNDPVSGIQFWVPDNPASIISNFADPNDIPTYAQNPYLLSNGKVLFESLENGFFGVVVEWDPVANTAVIRNDLPTGGPVVANASGTEVLFASNPSFYDSATDSIRTSSAVPGGILAAANPAGTQFVLFAGPGLTFIDAQFNVLGQIPLSVAGPQAGMPTGLVYSPDGTRLYMVTPGPVAVITTIDATNFTVLGTAPGYSNGSPVASSDIENPLAAEGTGLVIGSAVGGLVLDDSTDFQTLTNPTIISDGGVIAPSEGLVQGDHYHGDVGFNQCS